jgi:hypothetical protein
MQRPEVRIIEDQQVSSNMDVDNSEAAALLAKYGFAPPVTNQPLVNNPNQNLTADQLFEIQQREIEDMKRRELQRRNSPKPYGFNQNNINYSESKYSSLEGDDFGIQVQIVSDMPIYGNRRF